MPAQVISYIDIPGPDEGDRDLALDLASQGARVTRVVAHNPEAWSDFSDNANGQPAALDSGHVISHYGATAAQYLVVDDGRLVSTVASGLLAGYAGVTLDGNATRIGATFVLNPSASNLPGAGLAICRTPFNIASIPDMAVHLVVSPDLYQFGTWQAGVGLNQIMQHTWDTPLTDDGATEYSVDVQVIGDTAYLSFSNGHVNKITHADIADHAGPYVFWEVYAANAATDCKAEFSEVWADSAVSSPRTSAMSLGPDRWTRSGNTVARRHKPGSDADVTPGSFPAYTEIHSDLRCPVQFPDSGQIHVEFSCYLNAPASSPTIIGFFLDAGLTATSGLQWVHMTGDPAKAGPCTFSQILTYTPGTSTVIFAGLSKTGGTSVVKVGPNNPACIKVTPL